jgi:hypothetical protein
MLASGDVLVQQYLLKQLVEDNATASMLSPLI